MNVDENEQENENSNHQQIDLDQDKDQQQQGPRTVFDALKAAPAKRQKTGGAKASLLWDFFHRSAEKHNSSHYRATCRACSENGKQLCKLYVKMAGTTA